MHFAQNCGKNVNSPTHNATIRNGSVGGKNNEYACARAHSFSVGFLQIHFLRENVTLSALHETGTRSYRHENGHETIACTKHKAYTEIHSLSRAHS